ncbi:MAG: hypothetical protein Q7R69_01690 [bacterium]|nr:hypothetical protein [bacterium]
MVIRTARRRREERERYVEKDARTLYNPTLNGICITIAWATNYAMKGHPLNENHPKWAEYFAYSEWFRHRICAQLKLPLDTKWEDIYRRVGVLVEEACPSRDEFKRAYDFGKSQHLHDELGPEMFARFEMIKYQIVGRI